MAPYPLTRGSNSTPGADVLSDALIAVLEGYNAALKANVERLEAHNAALKDDIKNLKAKLAAERERADRAIRAFESQTNLEAMEAKATDVPRRRPWLVAAALFVALLFVATGVATVILLERVFNRGALDPLWPTGRIGHFVNVVITDAASARDLALRIGLAADNEDERR